VRALTGQTIPFSAKGTFAVEAQPTRRNSGTSISATLELEVVCLYCGYLLTMTLIGFSFGVCTGIQQVQLRYWPRRGFWVVWLELIQT
jgi:hypothetical protein